ncbi:hypothetical protein [Candidatus Reidiella endopervernicosa]|uniref:Uncharacterized protein n=1 Tax=Candidatus Reidiella endopervernicosa TaxID=2738883 RepID=A0A6N0HS09_9GAMM|nr:hypothetical protein [Candidatus Reidiella endopervernicosa]QKQ25153.1 hypothetical protein HUE57_01765 [Candidatus Reidiella endopervernicosa]
MYSGQRGELVGVETKDGEAVTGGCIYRPDDMYSAKLQGAKTKSGETVSGEFFLLGIIGAREQLFKTPRIIGVREQWFLILEKAVP